MQDWTREPGSSSPPWQRPPFASPAPGPMGPTQRAAGGAIAGRPRRPPYSLTQPPTPSLSWLSTPPGGCWHFTWEFEFSNDLDQRAFRISSATFETVNVQQQWQELDALVAHYRGFATKSATVQQATLAFVSDLSGVVRSLARQTNAGLTHAWTEGHTLHERVPNLDDQFGRLCRSGDELRAEQLSQLSVLTALQANTAAAVAAAAAAPDLATIKLDIEVEIKRAVDAQLRLLIDCINEPEQREAEQRRAVLAYVDQLKATMASAAAATGSTTGSKATPADPSSGPLKTKLVTIEAELQQDQLIRWIQVRKKTPW